MVPAKPRRVTSYDVAQHAGVSQATVSRVLTGNVPVSEDVRNRVQLALEELQFEPNIAARTMKTGRTGQIGVVMSAMTNPFHQELLREISGHLSEASLDPVVWYVDHGSDELAVRAIRQGGVDGVIHTAASPQSAAVEAAIDKGMPLVLMHRTVDGLFCDQVGGDNHDGGSRVAKYLAANGHTRIGMISASFDLSTARDRETGFRTGLRENGLDVVPEFTLRGEVSHQAGTEMAGRVALMEVRPTAIFATSDLLAFGMINGLRSHGIRVPEDIWVVGFDNTEMADWSSFALTSVNQPRHEMVAEAVRSIREQLAGTDRLPRTTHFPCQIVVRGSTDNIEVE